MAPARLAKAKQVKVEARNDTTLMTDALKTEKSDGKLKPIRRPTPSPSSKSSQASPTSTTRPPGSQSSPTGQRGAQAQGSIQSFFARAAQASAIPRGYTSSQGRAATPDEHIETIDDDDDIVSLSKGSSTATALRKRKFQLDGRSSSQQGQKAPLAAHQKFRKLDDGSRVTNSLKPRQDERPWTDRFGPTSLDELAVHKRKVDDVRGWLKDAFQARRNKALVLKGPAGTGKTTTIKLLAQAIGAGVVEWTPPAGKDNADIQSYAPQFEDFMQRSGRVTGLTLTLDGNEQSGQVAGPDHDESKNNTRHLLLVEDFPSTYSTASNAVVSFRSAIAQHLASIPARDQSPIPLIFVISETALSTSTSAADSFTTHRLLGPELGMHPYIDTIEFNPIAPTFMLKALELIVVKEARKSGRRTTPGKGVLKRLADFGDIRSASSTLEFLCLRGDDSNIWSAKVAFTKTKKTPERPLTQVEEEAVGWISSRASSLNIFHAVGKVVYNKRVPAAQGVSIIDPPPWLAEHKRSQVPENDANDLVIEVGTETGTFIAALHENYLLSCTVPDSEQAMNSVCGCIDNLSDSDLLCLDRFSSSGRFASGGATDTLRQDEISFQLSVRGVQASLPPNVKRIAPSGGDRRDAFRMYYPASTRIWRLSEETESALESVILALRAMRPPIASLSNMQSHLYNTTNTIPHAEHTGDADVDRSSITSLLRIPKHTVVLECLTYAYMILQIQDPNAPVLAQLRAVIKLAGFASDGTEEEGADDSAAAVSSWATDRPDDGLKRSRTTISGFQRRTANLPRASVPVEKEVASLVLSDDDIED